MSWAVVFENRTLPMLLAKLTPRGDSKKGFHTWQTRSASHSSDPIPS